MPDQLDITIDGRRNIAHQFDRLNHAINRLPYAVAVEIVDGGLAEAAKVPRKEARRKNRGFEDQTGRLRRSVKIQRRRLRGRRFVNIVAGGKGARQALIIDEGTGPRFKRSGAYAGRIRNRRFLVEAADERATDMTRVLVRYGRNRINMVARTARRGTGLRK